jgi:nucleoid-associated protein YgaU
MTLPTANHAELTTAILRHTQANEGKRSQTKELDVRRLSIVMALAGYGGLLVVLRPHGAAVANWTLWTADPERALVDAAALTGWALAAWLFVATALVVASQGPSVLGRLAAGVARMVTPRAARRLLEAALGVALAVGPAGAALAGPAVVPAGASVQLALDPVPAPIVAAAAPVFPDLDRPSGVASTPAVPTASAAPSSLPPTSAPTSAPASLSTLSTLPTPSTASRHTVVPGDTLWDLAAAASPPGASPAVITALWQQWYASNRATIGANPSLLLPGELLSLTGTS